MSALENLEQHRLRLEENVSKLRKALQHWLSWDAEYEGLKEEIDSLEDKSTDAEIKSTASGYEGVLLDAKEIRSLTGEAQGIRRNKQQVVDVISRRIDYVQQNAKTVERQLNTSQDKLNALLVVQQPEARTEDGLPLTEITEELDEDGNILSSNTSTPGSSASKVLEVLEKAGVKDIKLGKGGEAKVKPAVRGNKPVQTKSDIGALDQDKAKQSTRIEEMGDDEPITNSETIARTPSPPKLDVKPKPVTSVDQQSKAEWLRQRIAESGLSIDKGEGSSSATATQPSAVQAEQSQPLKSAIKTRADAESAVPIPKSVGFASQLDSKKPTSVPQSKPESSTSSSSGPADPASLANEDKDDDPPPIIPENESSEDAALRREMIAYGLNEVGAVVAELELDEGQSDLSYSDEYDEDDYDSSVEEDEDQYGRSTRKIVNDKYRQEMLELEKKLNVTGLQNAGPNPKGIQVEDPNKDKSAGHHTHQAMNEERSSNSSGITNKKTKQKKSVSFAQELDISEAPPPASETTKPKSTRPEASPHTDIIERRAPEIVQQSSEGQTNQRKPSRFKANRAAKAPSTQPSQKPSIASPHFGGAPQDLPLFPAKSAKPASTAPFNSPIQYPPPLAPSEAPEKPTPTGPKGTTHADKVIERPSPSEAPDPPDEHEIDDKLLRREAMMEYHKLRSRMIARQGGFSNEDDEDDDEEEAGQIYEEPEPRKKISRFMAARLK